MAPSSLPSASSSPVSPTDPGEELLLAPGWRPSRRAAVLVGAGVAAIAVVAGLAAARSSPDRPAARAPAAGPVAGANPPVASLRLDDPALHCPAGLFCRPDDSVPEVTDAAVAQYLPGAVARRRLTITVDAPSRRYPNRLYYRAVNATSGPVEVLVVVTERVSPPAPRTLVADPHPGAWIRYARRAVGHYEVQVQFTGPPGGTPSLSAAVDLARDPRLLAGG